MSNCTSLMFYLSADCKSTIYPDMDNMSAPFVSLLCAPFTGRSVVKMNFQVRIMIL